MESLQHVPQGQPVIRSGEVVQRWFSDFKQNGRKFIVPSLSMEMVECMDIPPLLQTYPDLKDAIIDFSNRNIGDISVNIMHEYINRCINILVEHENIYLQPNKSMFSTDNYTTYDDTSATIEENT